MEGFKKDNHYVPQAYLRQWSVNGRVLGYRLLVPHDKSTVWRPYSTKSIAMLSNPYSYFSGSKDSDEVERWLDHDFERPAFPAIAKVVSESPLTCEDWNNLYRFAVAQSIRTPARLHSFIKRQAETLQGTLSESMEESVAYINEALAQGLKLKSAPTEDYYRKLPLTVQCVKTSDGEEGIEARVLNGRKFWLWHIEHVLKNTILRMPSHRWTILHAPSGVSWPTTDNPFTRLGVGANGGWSFEGGWAVPGTRLFMPLSPKHLLFARVGCRPPQRGTTLSFADAAFYKAMILSGASRLIFATDTQDIEEFRPRTVSRELYDAEAKLWAEWHENQSKEEAEYPDL